MSIFSVALAENFLGLQYDLKPAVTIEIGAREAWFSKEMVNFNRNVFAFEANPHAYAEFSGWFTKEQYLNLAVSDKNGLVSLEFANEDKLGGAHSILKRTEYFDAGRVEVESVRLDDYILPKISPSDRIALWVDVEGATREVLSGAKEVLKQVDSIFIEVEHKHFWEGQMLADEVTHVLSEAGFSFLWRDYEWFPPDQPYPLQENYIFVRTSLLHN
jgi:FkbM family methyltransferase